MRNKSYSKVTTNENRRITRLFAAQREKNTSKTPLNPKILKKTHPQIKSMKFKPDCSEESERKTTKCLKTNKLNGRFKSSLEDSEQKGPRNVCVKEFAPSQYLNHLQPRHGTFQQSGSQSLFNKISEAYKSTFPDSNNENTQATASVNFCDQLKLQIKSLPNMRKRLRERTLDKIKRVNSILSGNTETPQQTQTNRKSTLPVATTEKPTINTNHRSEWVYSTPVKQMMRHFDVEKSQMSVAVIDSGRNEKNLYELRACPDFTGGRLEDLKYRKLLTLRRDQSMQWMPVSEAAEFVEISPEASYNPFANCTQRPKKMTPWKRAEGSLPPKRLDYEDDSSFNLKLVDDDLESSFHILEQEKDTNDNFYDFSLL